MLSSDLTEEELDNLIAKSKEILKKDFEEIKTFALKNILQTIEGDLKAFGVEHNKWFKESSMFTASKTNGSLISEALDSLKSKKKLYEKDGALWFQSTDFGDEKDRAFYGDPVIVDDLIYVAGYDGYLYAISKLDGSLWEQPIPIGENKDSVVGGVEYGDGVLLVGSSDGSIYGFDIEDNSNIWSFEKSSKIWNKQLI